MSRVLVLAVAIAACASPRRAPAPPASSVAELQRLLDATAARACACTDRACTAAVEADLATEIATARLPPRWLDDDAASRTASASEWRAIRCLQAHDTVAYGYEGLTVRYEAAVRDDLCACQDNACIDAVRHRSALAFLYARSVPIDEATGEELDKIEAAETACVRAPDAATIDAAIGALTALKDRACKCVDEACATGVQSDLTAWGTKNVHLHTTADDDQQMYSIALDLGACLHTVRSGK